MASLHDLRIGLAVRFTARGGHLATGKIVGVHYSRGNEAVGRVKIKYDDKIIERGFREVEIV